MEYIIKAIKEVIKMSIKTKKIDLFDKYQVVYQSKGVNYRVKRVPTSGFFKEYHPINRLDKADLIYSERYEDQYKIVYNVTVNNSKLTYDEIAYSVGGYCSYGYNYLEDEGTFIKYFD